MGVSSSWSARDRRWQVTVRRDGKRVCRNAPQGMGKREAERVIGEAILREMQGAAEATAPVVTLSDFCARVYAQRHGLSPRTWRAREYLVADIMDELGGLRLDELTTGVFRAWMERLRRHS